MNAHSKPFGVFERQRPVLKGALKLLERSKGST